MFRKHTGHRSTVAALTVGLVLTVVATAAPFVDRASSQRLGAHIRDGYPGYDAARVDEAVSTWLVVLAVVGVLGVLTWAGTIWATARGKSWSRWAVTGGFALGTTVALIALLTEDTSGEVGLAPVLGWIGMLPTLAGLAAVAVVWRGPPLTRPGRPDAGAR